jgi:hypothetical protein
MKGNQEHWRETAAICVELLGKVHYTIENIRTTEILHESQGKIKRRQQGISMSKREKNREKRI